MDVLVLEIDRGGADRTSKPFLVRRWKEHPIRDDGWIHKRIELCLSGVR